MADILRLKRRAAGGAAGPPGSLAAAEIAFNEQDNTLYYGKGNSAGNATSIIAIGGPGTFAPLASPAFTGTPTSATNPLNTDNSHTLATTAFVQSVVTSTGVQTYNGRSGAVVPLLTDITGVGGAPIASPLFTGDPRAPTPLLTDNDTSIATTAYVQGQGYATTASLPLASITNPLPDGTVAIGSATTRYALADHVHPTDGSRAPINNPTFTGTVTLPSTTFGTTQAIGDEDTSMATTAFVARGMGGLINSVLSPVDTDTTYTSAQIGVRLINVTGALTADRTITLPITGQQKVWEVRNGTTGGFNIIVAGGVGTFSIPPGLVGEIWSNGSGLFPAQNISLGTTFRIGDTTRNAFVVTTGTAAAATTITTSGTGVLTFGEGVSFGSTTVPSGLNTDLTRHISLYGVNYGFGVTSSRLNYVSGGAHVFLAGGTDRVTIGTTGLTMTTGNPITLPDLPTVGTSAANKNYVDAHVSPVLATIAALRTSTSATLTASVCTVQSYATTPASAVGKGGGTFIYISTDTTSADNAGTIIVDASSRRWYRHVKNEAPLNVHWFGAVGDGVTNDVAAIQATYNALPAGGGVVEFSIGTYNINAAISITTSNTITQGNGSLIQTTSLTADHFQLAAGISRLTFFNLEMWATVVKTAGACFNALGDLNNSNFYNVQCGSMDLYQGVGGAHRLWVGYQLKLGFQRIFIDAGCVVITAYIGVVMAGYPVTGGASELTICGRILFCQYGMIIGGGCGGIYMNGEISQCGTGCRIDTTLLNVINREIFFWPGAILDSCADYGLQTLDNSVVILHITGAWFTSAGKVNPGQGVGLYLGSNDIVTPYGQALITGARFYNNTVTGLVAVGMSCNVSGCLFDRNATGMVLGTTGANGTLVAGNEFFENTTAGLTIQGNINQYTIQTNYFFSAAAAINGPNVAYTSQASVASSNTGFPVRASGTAVMNGGTQTTTFTHGLGQVPNQFQITTNDPAHTFAVGASTTTSLTVNANAVVPTPVSIWWEVSMSVGANP